MAARKWTPEQRALQAQKIQQWKPWQLSTGPKSEQGKAASSRNALLHGLRSAEQQDLCQAIARAMDLLKDFKP